MLLALFISFLLSPACNIGWSEVSNLVSAAVCVCWRVVKLTNVNDEKFQRKIPVTSHHRDSCFSFNLGGVGFNPLGKAVTLSHRVSWNQGFLLLDKPYETLRKRLKPIG